MGAVVFPTFFLDNHGMALIVFLRSVNVGGHRAFRPSILARELSDYDVVNVGAAGTILVSKPGARASALDAGPRELAIAADDVRGDCRDRILREDEGAR